MTQASVARISKRVVDAAPVPAAGESRIWDSELKGSSLRVYPTGRRVYALKHRRGAVRRVLTIGVHGSPWTRESARERAREALGAIRHGEDPAAAKRAARAALSVKDLIETYLADGPATKPGKRESTWANDASNFRLHIEPLLGRRPAFAVTKEEAARSISDIAAGKTAAERTASGKKRGRVAVRGGEGVARRTRLTAAAMFAWGVEHGRTSGENPCARVRLSAPPVRERFLTRDEAALLRALRTWESTISAIPSRASP